MQRVHLTKLKRVYIKSNNKDVTNAPDRLGTPAARRACDMPQDRVKIYSSSSASSPSSSIASCGTVSR